MASNLYHKNGALRGSVTRFESYQACPFKHFVQYGLGLKERAVFAFKAPDLGVFLHAVLKNFGDDVQRSGRSWGSLTTAECAGLCVEIVNKLAPRLQNEILLSTEQHRHILKRLTERANRVVGRLADFARASCFQPLALEQTFGLGAGSLPPLSWGLPDGNLLQISGQIDRIDTCDSCR